MVSKDQGIGGLIFIVCVVIIIGYIVTLFAPWWVVNTLKIGSESGIRYWLAEIPVLVAVVAVLAIGAWIGWTMATTPPPKPIEEIEAEEKKEEEKEKPEEEKEEEKKK
jgi:predicted DNA-binding transcriptional regulator